VTDQAPDSLLLDFQAAVAGRFSIDRELGRGGMGVVYLAREVRLDRLVAIKLLPPGLVSLLGLRERFLAEARTAAQLSQPNIVPIYAVDEAGGYVFLVMAYVEGETLGQRVRRRGPIQAFDAAKLLRDLAWALAYAHAQGVVHRDIKPDNVLLEEATARVLLADFGIAQRLDPGAGAGTGELIGTPEYMSPEQTRGEPVDGRSDIYSVGVVGFFAVTGQLPFEAESPLAVLELQRSSPPPSLGSITPGIPPAYQRVVSTCLAKRPADRFQSAADLAAALSAMIEVRREVPPPIRLFAKTTLEPQASGCLYVAGMFWLAPLVALAAQTLDLSAAGLYVAFLTIGFAVVPATLHWLGARRLVRGGFDVEDLLAGIRVEHQRRREELAVRFGGQLPSPRTPSRVAWVGIGASIAGLGVGLLGYQLGLHHVLGPIGSVLVGGGLVTSVIGSALVNRRRDVIGERRLKYWGSKFGRWVFKVAGIGLDRRRLAAADSYRATELAIALAAEDLFESLPRVTRKSLAGLPDAVRQLEGQAARLRRRLDEVERWIADARPGSAGRAEGSELATIRDDLRERHTEVVTALETLRLDLLRLHAGSGTVERLTLDLESVASIGSQVDRLLEGKAEIEAALDPGPKTS
jgi:eukaryotic-like serine/threonine-protein kinase